MPVRAFEERRPSLQLALVKPKTTVTHYARIKRDAKKTHPDVRKFLAPVAQMSRTSKRTWTRCHSRWSDEQLTANAKLAFQAP